jgi:hypothetical protein
MATLHLPPSFARLPMSVESCSGTFKGKDDSTKRAPSSSEQASVHVCSEDLKYSTDFGPGSPGAPTRPCSAHSNSRPPMASVDGTPRREVETAPLQRATTTATTTTPFARSSAFYLAGSSVSRFHVLRRNRLNEENRAGNGPLNVGVSLSS